ncbi:hypothetical protein HH214_18805 [Mucilaginibacter robiniae]|uniref:Uncharacterized protein n=1 Tax=Mucilaginibacter robiniae TaxID=2728022 RepID=A0A7L5E5V8_9SPHI|nr:hypothetical protein [Mucilaginibacter robiniae]QJD97777.1 hypothetical protein HH214_18805 [Mucilaginibacter robiniae]
MKKKILLAFASIYSSVSTYAQQTSIVLNAAIEKPHESKYLTARKTLKNAGWISLETGIPLFCLGFAYAIGSIDNHNKTGAKTARWMVPSGAALTLTSIPCFVLSHHYKRKAATLSLNNQPVFIPLKNGFSSSMQPALCLRFPL